MGGGTKFVSLRKVPGSALSNQKNKTKSTTKGLFINYVTLIGEGSLSLVLRLTIRVRAWMCNGGVGGGGLKIPKYFNGHHLNYQKVQS